MAGTTKTNGPRRVIAVMIVLSAGIAGLVAAGACLPDLAPIPSEEAGIAVASAFRGCGDGIIATLADGTDSGESCDPGSDAGGDAQVSCKDCQIRCPGGFIDPRSGHCYFVLPDNDSSYSNALKRCSSERAHLLTLSSVEEIDFVATITADEAGYWVGLARSPSFADAYEAARSEEPGFPSPPDNLGSSVGPCEGCFAVGAEAGVLPSAEPDASDASAASAAQRCVASVGNRWFQVACEGTTKRRTVCEREPVGVRAVSDCIIGGFCFTVPETAGTKSYLVVVSATDPDQAAQSCAALDGGSLVVINSRAEREQIAHEILARDTQDDQELWIGLSSEDGGAWHWEDRELVGSNASRPLPWGNAEPVLTAPGARAFMRLTTTAYDTQLAHADDGGKAPRLYICQRPAR